MSATERLSPEYLHSHALQFTGSGEEVGLLHWVGELCFALSPRSSKELRHRALGEAQIQVDVRVWPCCAHFPTLTFYPLGGVRLLYKHKVTQNQNFMIVAVSRSCLWLSSTFCPVGKCRAQLSLF